ncbi:EGF-like domain-containing protein [Tieghemostelium lacteum]|uniref:EGF-like domain-containing protein n=1 Tax=Tieghemostelium lacteum TaxID=361077 RepID=A0A151Z3R3_TIELA|nr:EGF-like domain-containing protein [Tieghemostelium lacteum]|eukprot:KYQ88585.1 EGF-like domain-containing protein [Tieghemostelium lacteum]
MNYSYIIRLTLVLAFLFSLTSADLDGAQLSALQTVNNVLSQTWDVSSAATVCTANINFIKCDTLGTVVKNLYIKKNPPTSVAIPNALFQLVNLSTLYADQQISPYNIQIGSTFWDGIGSLTSLQMLVLNTISEDIPANINTLLPPSLYYITIYEFYYSYPQSLFYNPKISNIGLGSFNKVIVNIFPATIPGVSQISSLATSVMGNFNLAGNNFTNLYDLNFKYRGSTNPMTYNWFDTWTAKRLFMEFVDIPASSLFSSIFSMNSLIYFRLYANSKLNINNEVYDFSHLPGFFLELENVNQLPNLQYPGIKLHNTSSSNLYLTSCTIDFTKIDILSIPNLNIKSSTFNNGLPDGDYSKMKSLTIDSMPTYTGPITNSVCSLPTLIALTVTNTGITTIPSCYLCQWGNPQLTSQFANNPSLNPTRSCPNLEVTNYTSLIPTKDGVMEIYGVDLGWVIYDETGDVLETTVIVGNSHLSIPVVSGSGTLKSIKVKFHANVDSSAIVNTLFFSYLPPTITSIVAQNSIIIIQGSNFIDDTTITQLYVAGKQVEVETATFNVISSKFNSVPYNDNLTVSIRLVVDGQEVSQVVQPPNAVHKLYEPLPNFYSIGGYVEIPGQYLTYDNTIMNMTINGITFEIESSTSDMYLIKYDPISPGNYPFEFNLLGYQLKSSITVRSVDTSPCKGTPTCGGPSQGICVENHCECLDGWKGEICDSQVIALPPPSTPSTDQPSYITSSNNIGLQVSIKSVRELNFNQNLIREQPLSSWTFNQNSTSEKQSLFYTTSPFTNCSIEVSIDYFNKDSIVQFANINSTKHSGTIKYSIRINSWPFIQKTNQLQLIFQSTIKDNDNSKDSCSYKTIEYEDNDNVQNVKTVDIQLNDKTFSSSFSELAVVDGLVRKVNNVIILNSDQDENDSNTQSQSFIGINTPYHNDYIIIDPDFSLLVSYVPPEDKEGSICSSPSKSKLTKAQLAGIIVAASVVFIVAVIIFGYLLYSKSLKAKLFFHSVNTKLSVK